MLLCISGFIHAIQFMDFEPMQQLPLVYDFNGDHATHCADSTVYFVYTTSVNEPQAGKAVCFAQIHDYGLASYQLLFTPLPNAQIGTPTLLMNSPQIHISFTRDGEHFIYYSPDLGQNWQVQSYPALDAVPLLYETLDGLQSYSVKYDPYGSDYVYFTEQESSTNDTSVYFYGPDVLSGKVRSNSALWLKQAGGGNNNGWPTFYGQVITAEQAMSASGAFPFDMVFRGGLVENAPPLEYTYDLLIGELRRTLPAIGDPACEDDIYMAVVNGTTVDIMRGIVSDPVSVFADVYSQYPPATGDPLWRNLYDVRDTTWVPVESRPLGAGFFSHNTLWLKGTFSGNVTIACAKDIYLIGDILLENTALGSAPDQDPVNTLDKVSLVSEKRIIIKYGYRDPVTGLRVHPNCDTYPGGVYIYADLITPVPGENNFSDGVFTFEYQRPHGSTPSFCIGDTVYHNIDLHRNRYPQTAAQPWPPELDYPWYNPLWPERAPYKERGVVHLWGSVLQRRRGYLHRSVYDTEYPSNGVWNIDIDYTGASANSIINDPVTGLTLAAVNYPGAAGSGVGYQKNYNYDSRVMNSQLRNTLFGLGIWIRDPANPDPLGATRYIPMNEEIRNKTLDRLGEQLLFHLNNTFYTLEDAYPQDLPPNWQISKAKLLDENRVLSVWESEQNGFTMLELRMMDLQTGISTLITQTPQLISLSWGFSRIGDRYLFCYSDINSYTVSMNVFDTDCQLVDSGCYDDYIDFLANKKIYCTRGEGNDLYLLLWQSYPNPMDNTLYFSKGSLETSSAPQEEQIPSLFKVACHPNPFQEHLSIRIQSSKNQAAEISIYNLKGQLVRSFKHNLKNGISNEDWDGKDQSGRAVSNGIYYIQIKSTDYNKTKKTLKLK
ncbi:MAG: T9SS type A sorting domain-containing protein [Candidatus Cloacimonetes bacterium]|nr:T9SS type A sorting domain-containing protein [Candidatus Cloacimonadota bacterium]